MNLGAMGKMVGPLPLGAWVATVGGAVAVSQVAKLRGKKAKGADTGEALPVYNAGALPFAPLQEPMWGGAVGLPSTAMPAAGPAQITNNTEWQRAAAADLAARGDGGYGAQQALAKYLQGLDALEPAEAAMVEAALRHTGYPPQPPSIAPPPLPAAAPPPKAPAAPASPDWLASANNVYDASGARTGYYQMLKPTPGSNTSMLYLNYDPHTRQINSGYVRDLAGNKHPLTEAQLDIYRAQGAA